MLWLYEYVEHVNQSPALSYYCPVKIPAAERAPRRVARHGRAQMKL